MNNYKETFKKFFEQYYLALKGEDDLYVQAIHIPEEMLVGTLDEDGWGTWKLVESTITDQDIIDLESELEIKLPAVFKAFLTTYHHYFNAGIGINPIDRPLYEVRKSKNDVLINHGFVPFAWDEDDAYIYCIDCKTDSNEIYKIDHDIVYDFEPNVSEETLSENMQLLAPNLISYLQQILIKQQAKAKINLKQSK